MTLHSPPYDQKGTTYIHLALLCLWNTPHTRSPLNPMIGCLVDIRNTPLSHTLTKKYQCHMEHSLSLSYWADSVQGHILDKQVKY